MDSPEFTKSCKEIIKMFYIRFNWDKNTQGNFCMRNFKIIIQSWLDEALELKKKAYKKPSLPHCREFDLLEFAKINEFITVAGTKAHYRDGKIIEPWTARTVERYANYKIQLFNESLNKVIHQHQNNPLKKKIDPEILEVLKQYTGYHDETMSKPVEREPLIKNTNTTSGAVIGTFNSIKEPSSGVVIQQYKPSPNESQQKMESIIVNASNGNTMTVRVEKLPQAVVEKGVSNQKTNVVPKVIVEGSGDKMTDTLNKVVDGHDVKKTDALPEITEEGYDDKKTDSLPKVTIEDDNKMTEILPKVT